MDIIYLSFIIGIYNVYIYISIIHIQIPLALSAVSNFKALWVVQCPGVSHLVISHWHQGFDTAEIDMAYMYVFRLFTDTHTSMYVHNYMHRCLHLSAISKPC